MTNKNKQPDIFAGIATQRLQLRNKELHTPEPPELPDKILPLTTGDKCVQQEIPKQMDSAEELQQELEKFRKQYEPFLQNLAPEYKSLRSRKNFGEFDWKIETDTDKNNFLNILQGKGNWEKVTIPHYGPPLGKAATWYKTEFQVQEKPAKDQSLFICFKGVDYKAHIFINGSFIGSHEGFFAPFEFEITNYVNKGANSLLIKVENDFICMGSRTQESEERFEGDKIYAATGCGYDDPQVGWHHCPPGMGIYQDVFLETRPRIFIKDIFVRPMMDAKQIEIWLDIFHCDIQPREIEFNLSIYGQNFKACLCQDNHIVPSSIHVPGLGDVSKRDDKNISLPAGPGVNTYKFTVAVDNPKIWSLTEPWLYQMHISLLDNHQQKIDAFAKQFGIRSFTQDTESEPKGMFYLNKQAVRLRGANTMGHLQQCVIKKDWSQLIDDILLAKICNMNFLRLTQRPVQPEIYEYCDRLGLMVQTDLPLFGVLRKNQFCEAVRQTEEMEKLVRNHPCNVLISYINEPFPNAMDKPHRHLLRKELENFFEAADLVVKLNNPDRVIKAVDGDYDPPGPGLPDNHCYNGWYNGHGLDLGKLHKGYWQPVKKGWYYACGEFGSEGLESESVMRKYYPKEWLPQSESEEKNWSPNSIVNAQSGRFHYMWYDSQYSLQNWIHASQKHQVRITRLVTEAFRRDSRMVSFAIHLFIDAFPSGWMKTIMDVERQPKPAYFTYRNALSPVMTSLRTDKWIYFENDEIQIETWVCNDTNESLKDVLLSYSISTKNGSVIYSGNEKVKIPVNSSQFCGYIKFKAPACSDREKLYITTRLVSSEKCFNTGDITVDILPQDTTTSNLPIYITSSSSKDKAWRLLDDLGLSRNKVQLPKESLIILIDNFQTFHKQKEEIEKAVRRGALAVFLELDPGEYKIADSEITVSVCGMGDRHFVSRDTGHHLVADFDPDDFWFWYDPKTDCPSPILHTTFDTKNWQAILKSGNGDWTAGWKPVFAAAEKTDEKGMWRICQVELSGRTNDNPIASIFAKRLLMER